MSVASMQDESAALAKEHYYFVHNTWSILGIQEHLAQSRPALSDPITCDPGLEFHIEFRPATQGSGMYRVHLYLDHCAWASSVRAHYSLYSMLMPNGGPHQSEHIFDEDTKVFQVQGVGHGRGHPQDHLADPYWQLLLNDMLTIHAEITVYDDRYPVHGHHEPCKLQLDMAAIYQNPSFPSDVSLHCDGQEFAAHRLILAARSPVFAVMFANTDNKEVIEGRVDIADLCPEVLGELLKYIYSGRLDSIEHATELLYAADKYELDELKALTEQRLQSTLSIDSVVQLLQLAYLHCCDELKAACLNFICHNQAQVRLSQSWNELTNSKWWPALSVELLRITWDK